MVSTAASAQEAGNWSHRCTACGKCCNSPPQMSLPELFHHQHRFIGTLGVRRVFRPLLAEAAEHAPLADKLLHRTGSEHLALLTQAIDYPTSNRCPALAPDGLCEVHDNRKPRACVAVPLDALLPDSLQHAVLARRSAGGVEYIGADCIVADEREGFRAQTRQRAMIDPLARQALDAHRDELAADKHFWGNAVFSELQQDLLSQRGGLASIPALGAMTLPLAPAIIVLANVSSLCRWRCVEYLEAQLALMENSVSRALQRKLPAERAFTAQLRNFIVVTTQLLLRLQQQAYTSRAANADEIETWLGVNANEPSRRQIHTRDCHALQH